jgi:hypothetical protein
MVESRGRECCFRITNIAGSKDELVTKLKLSKIKDTLKRTLQIAAGLAVTIQGLFNNYLQNQVL